MMLVTLKNQGLQTLEQIRAFLDDSQPLGFEAHFLRFLETVEEADPDRLDIHLVLDNYATHKSLSVQKWLVKRPRFHVHYSPTYSSWLNLVERWFAVLSERKIKSADQILASIRRFCHYALQSPGKSFH